MIRYFLLFIWVELICLFAFSCTSPSNGGWSKPRRGDWMEHLNYRQFSSRPLSIQWDRHNYYSLEELQEKWRVTYNKAIRDIEQRLAEIEHEDIH